MENDPFVFLCVTSLLLLVFIAKFLCVLTKKPLPQRRLLSSGTGSARFSIKRSNCSLIAARKLDCLLASRLCIWASREQCSTCWALRVALDGTLVHLKRIVFVLIIEHEFKSRARTLFCDVPIMTETRCLRYRFGCG